MMDCFETTIEIPVQVYYDYDPGEPGGRTRPASPPEAEITAVLWRTRLVSVSEPTLKQLQAEALDHVEERRKENAERL